MHPWWVQFTLYRVKDIFFNHVLHIFDTNNWSDIYDEQDIIQGLKESGVFASVIASAQTASSDRKDVASDNETSFSRKSSMEYPGLTRRKVLEEAIPPLSPPRNTDKI